MCRYHQEEPQSMGQPYSHSTKEIGTWRASQEKDVHGLPLHQCPADRSWLQFQRVHEFVPIAENRWNVCQALWCQDLHHTRSLQWLLPHWPHWPSKTKDSICHTSWQVALQHGALWFSPSPSYFQQLMNQVLQGLDFAIAYLDDIIIFSNNEVEHLQHLETVFKRLKYAGLKLKESKCDFFRSQIHYLGHMLLAEGIHPYLRS